MRRGAALVLVLMALALLFALGVPFLFLGRIRTEAARDGYDDERARAAVESATAYALASEAESHPSTDPTPLWDSIAEWDPARSGVLPEALGEDWEHSGQSWGLEVEAGQGRVSLASAPLVLLQNLLHPCFISEDTDFRATELPVTSTAGFPDKGLLFLGGLWVAYGARNDTSFLQVAPAEEPPEDLTATRFRAGFTVVDPRVYSLALARLRGTDQVAPEFYSDLFDADALNLGTLPEEDRARLQRLTVLRSGAYGAEDWEPALYLGLPPGQETPEWVRVSDGSGVARGTLLRFLPEDGPPVDSFVVAQQGNALLLPTDVAAGFEPFSTRIYPLRREPVDLNSASAEVLAAVAMGLRWDAAPPVHPLDGETVSGSPQNDWISPRKAREFASKVLAARPLHGPEDLWERVLAPLAKDGVLSDVEALALHLNGLDPNDGRLDQSTVSFGYRSGDRYLQRVNAAVRSPIGATLARRSMREEVQSAPSGPLLRLWRTQQDFEDAGRFGRGLHAMTTLPYALGSGGGEHAFSDPLTLRTGLREPPGSMKPSDDAEQSAVMPMPVRELDDFGQAGYGHTEHFDFEPSPLGYDAAERGPWRTSVVEWNLLQASTGAGAPTGAGVASSAVEPLHFQGWFEMPRALSDSALFDVAGTEVDRSRIQGAIENGKLVVRGYDNAGDDPLDEDRLIQAVETRVDPAEYPLADRWMHLSVLLRGIAPRGLQVAVDGVPRGHSNVLTYTTAAVPAYTAGSTDDEIPVESTEGFPSRGALRIGREVLEYSAKTAHSFVTARSNGTNGYVGGRAAREVGDIQVNTLDTSHPAGAAVELYGYSAVLDSPVPPGGGRLSGDVGTWSMATAIKGKEDINYTFISTTGQSVTLSLGKGLTCQYLGPVELAPAYAGDNSYANAFQSDGGYALLVQYVPNFGGVPVLGSDGCRVGGVEMVQYSARQGTTLTLSQRNVQAPGFVGAPMPYFAPQPAHFVTEWADYIVRLPEGTPLNKLPEWRVFVIPVSIKGGGVSDVAYLPGGQFSEYVQLTHDSDAGLTEWVRYDHIIGNSFVRDDWNAVFAAFNTYIVQQNIDVPQNQGGGGGGPGPGGGGGPGGHGGGPGPRNLMLDLLEEPGAESPAAQQQQEGDGNYTFVRKIGAPEPNRIPALEQLRKVFDHRGVMNTYDHPHQPQVRLVPVFRTLRDLLPWSGFAGRLDRVAVMQPGGTLPPIWFTVQWSAAPRPDADARVKQNVTYVGFLEDPALPFALNSGSFPNLYDPNQDVRALPRLLKFPSGERPLDLEQIVLGGDASGGAGRFAGHIDEVSVHTTVGMGQPGYGAARGGFLLSQDLSDGAIAEIPVDNGALIKDGRLITTPNPGDFLKLVPKSGLLDIDGERFGYYDVDAGRGVFLLNDTSRGLHGTQARGHASGAVVWISDGRPAAALTAGMTPGEAVVNLEATAAPFPQQGLLLLDQELLQTFYQPGQDPNQRAMPRRRPRPEDTDRIGDGILRGRFGTTPADHGVGALAYSFPARWHDRYVPESNDPAGGWFEIGLEEPNAWWRGLSYEAEVPDSSQTVRVLARGGTAGWEDKPAATPGLKLIEQPHAPNGGLVPLGLFSDRLDLRVSFDWGPGAFDPVNFTATGWTTAPRLRSLIIDYLADARVNARQEVSE